MLLNELEFDKVLKASTEISSLLITDTVGEATAFDTEDIFGADTGSDTEDIFEFCACGTRTTRLRFD